MLPVEDLRNNVSIELELNTWEMAIVVGASMNVASNVRVVESKHIEIMHSIGRFIGQIDLLDTNKTDGVDTVEIPLDLLDEVIQMLYGSYSEIVNNSEDEKRLQKLINLLSLKANSAWFRMISSVRARVTETLGGLEIACESLGVYHHLKASRLSEIQQLLMDIKGTIDKTGSKVTK